MVSNGEFFLEENKIKWAEILLKSLSYETLGFFNDVVLKGSYESFLLAREKMANDLLRFSEKELIKKITACPSEEAFNFLAQPKKQISCNEIGFRSHIFSIKNELIKRPPKSCKIFHDEQVQFRQLFEEFIEMTTNGPATHTKIGNSTNIIWGNIGEWRLSFEKSHNTPLIKIADLFCSYFREVLISLRTTGGIGASSQELYNLFWTPLFRHIYPEKFGDLPEWYYEGVSMDLQVKLIRNLIKPREDGA